MITLIAAVFKNRVIGLNNDLIVRLPQDMKNFRRVTSNNTVVMGRRTWESLDAEYRPLPNRQNIVLSQDPGYRAPGAVVADSLRTAIDLAQYKIFVIGGADIFSQAIGLADSMVITHIDAEPEGDCFFPVISKAWTKVTESNPISEVGYTYTIAEYEYL